MERRYLRCFGFKNTIRSQFHAVSPVGQGTVDERDEKQTKAMALPCFLDEKQAGVSFRLALSQSTALDVSNQEMCEIIQTRLKQNDNMVW